MSPLQRRTFLIMAISAMAAAQAPAPSLLGCYSSSQPLTNEGTDIYQSSGECGKTCSAFNSAVFAMSQGNLCFCGNTLPAQSAITSDSDCSTPCVGYPDEMCGGSNAFSVYLSGTNENPPVFGGSSGGSSSDSSSSASPTITSTPTTSTRSPQRTGKTRATVVTSINRGTTVYVTDAPTTSSTAGSSSGSNSNGGGTSVGAIAGGVVVGVVAVAGVVLGVWFFLRRRRQKATDDEYKRTQVADFMRGGEGKPPNTGYSHSSDSRLDPEAGARRNSQGSIADAGDYSRRILRVANPT